MVFNFESGIKTVFNPNVKSENDSLSLICIKIILI
jgi:hypothetical protein